MWQPLTDHWTTYTEHIQEAAEAGLLDDPLDADEIVYPDELHVGEGEKDDLRDFITERLQELYGHYQATGGGFDPSVIGTYIFRAILMGMLWERDRIGR